MERMKPTLGPGADAVGTEFSGPAFIGRDSFVTRSIIGDYFSIGWNLFVF